MKKETEDFKPGSIVDRVKEELDRTIAAKRRLLEKNFINFRFDEFKANKISAFRQLEEFNQKKKRNLSISKNIENHHLNYGMWKSIEVYTP